MIAGKYAELMRSPAAAMAVGGLGAAGASLVSNQGDDKSTGRQALEALGAGALGAGVGRMLPTVNRIAAENAANQRARFVEGLQTKGSGVQRAVKGAYDRKLKPEEVEAITRIVKIDDPSLFSLGIQAPHLSINLGVTNQPFLTSFHWSYA